MNVRWVVALVALASMVSAPVHASVNLYWRECSGEGGVMLETFACNTNAGGQSLVASVIPNDDHAGIAALEAVVDFCSMSEPFPDWWQFGTGACRAGALSLSLDFTSSLGATCTDPWGGSATGLATAYVYPGPWNRGRITVVATPLQPVPMTAAVQYYAFKLTLSNARTIGADACSGCATPVCIVLNQVTLIDENATSEAHTSPEMNYSGHWQNVLVNCPFIVPTANRTWGEIKSLYR